MAREWPGGMIGKVPRFNAANVAHVEQANKCRVKTCMRAGEWTCRNCGERFCEQHCRNKADDRRAWCGCLAPIGIGL